ncbi:hypothetical protein BRADI_2g46263v3 [Brachypodium distachyon]|uniref:Uncharacterized protein n=1 Tax=Brachypodium distachyon TaxID=15368 RepID=A0A0Q3MXW7_BRADI|nr:hypothetical protein BRADI_2g46263v3 [Brachypodium distachyon]
MLSIRCILTTPVVISIFSNFSSCVTAISVFFWQSLLTFSIAILITSWEMLSTQMGYLCGMRKRLAYAAILRTMVLEQQHSLCIEYLRPI